MVPNDFVLFNSPSVVLTVDLQHQLLIADWADEIQLDDWSIVFDLMAQIAFNNDLDKALGLVQGSRYSDALAAELYDFQSDYDKLWLSGLKQFAFVAADKEEIALRAPLSEELLPKADISWFTDVFEARAWLLKQ